MHATLYCGDNLRVMEGMAEESVDLCYIDPPFFSRRHYELLWGETAERRLFTDRWQGGLQTYLNWMEPRLRQIHRLLSPKATLFAHCDWHAGHYLKVVLDDIFGYNHFLNEIIWHYPNKLGTGGKIYDRQHDMVLWYGKGKQHFYQPTLVPVSLPKPQPVTQKIGGKRLWVRDDQGRRVYKKSTTKRLGDVWTLPIINPMSRERLGYPTQKPEVLLHHIIGGASARGEMVFDPFCGCGTSLAVAQQLSRKWCGCDVSPTALRIVKERLSKLGAGKITVIGMPATTEELRAMDPFEFENWAISTLFGIHSPSRVADRGIDGFTGWKQTPIQVKQQEHVGRPVVQQFRGALGGKNKGVIVGLGFARTAHEEAARLKREEHIEIVLVTPAEMMQADFDTMGL